MAAIVRSRVLRAFVLVAFLVAPTWGGLVQGSAQPATLDPATLSYPCEAHSCGCDGPAFCLDACCCFPELAAWIAARDSLSAQAPPAEPSGSCCGESGEESEDAPQLVRCSGEAPSLLGTSSPELDLPPTSLPERDGRVSALPPRLTALASRASIPDPPPPRPVG